MTKFCMCKNGKKFANTDEFELKPTYTNLFYNLKNRKPQGINTCNDMQPSKEKKKKYFYRENQVGKTHPLRFVNHMRIKNYYNVSFKL